MKWRASGRADASAPVHGRDAVFHSLVGKKGEVMCTCCCELRTTSQHIQARCIIV